ncbi:MAG TPA: thiolase family protein [Acidimicrobiia bacterium]|nr:thiolase family protein [Acidimicrobiia bacterium]
MTGVIAGIGLTAAGELDGRSTVSLNVEACRAALDDAQIGTDLVDAVFVKFPTSQLEFMYATKVAAALGIDAPAMVGSWDQGGAANISMISQAVLAIEAGQIEVALVTAADNPRSGTRQAYEKVKGADGPYGWIGVAADYALITRRYLDEHGLSDADLAPFAIAARRHGADNPAAQLRKPLALEQYLAEPYVVEPLRRSDICLVSDGGGAVVVTSARHAAQLGVPAPVPVLGVGHAQRTQSVIHRSDLLDTAAGDAGARAFASAGLKPGDIDVAQLYDCFTVVPALTLEAYGFCGNGQAAAFARNEGIELGGRLPLNTSGGLLAETGMPGMQLVVEGVRQMRGTAVNQVTGASTCIVSNQGGSMTTHATMILGAS